MEEGCTYGIENEKCCVRFAMHSIEFRCVTEGEEDQLRRDRNLPEKERKKANRALATFSSS